MRNPGESPEGCVQSETSSEAYAKGSDRDECDSPPCKRLKQGVLSFPTVSSSLLTSTGSFKTSVSVQNEAVSISNCQNTPSEPCKEKTQSGGGLVTGAPSPPDLKESFGKAQNTTDSSKISKSLVLENKDDKLVRQRDVSSISSPESTSSSHEDEAMVIDQSLPVKGNRKSPTLKSAEKLKRKEEREKERQEKQRLREEKLKEKQEAKAAKEKERSEAKRKRDLEKQEKQAERERREKERIERKEKEEKERLEKKGKREEERRKREEENNAKLEEKRKREEEKRNQEEEQTRKRLKSKEHFVSWFTKTSTPKASSDSGSRFKPFQLKAGMTIAPATRKHLSLETKKVLDEELKLQEDHRSYLRDLEARKPILKYRKRKLSTIEEQNECDTDEKTSDGPLAIDENSNSSVEIVEKKKDISSFVGLRCKLLQFHTDYRPAYFGTYRKKSYHISPRNPFKKDLDLLDYEVDSDDEWEEEEPGESLSHSEGEDEGDGDDDNGDDDGFFVPHGYLSDDEGVEDGDDDECDVNEEKKEENPENKRDQQLAKAKAWEAAMKRKCKPMKPISLGCLWLEEAEVSVVLKQFAACLLVDGPINIESLSTNSKSADFSVDTPSSGNTSGALYVPDKAMPDLIKLVHGNTAGLSKLMMKFRKHWTSKWLGRDVTDEEVDEKSPISKRQLEKKIQNIASKERRNDRPRWYVHSHILEAYGIENLLVDGCTGSDASSDTPKSSATLQANTPSIIQFAARGASPEMQNNTPKIQPASLSCTSTSNSPMEIDNKGLTGFGGILGSNVVDLHSQVDGEPKSNSTAPIRNNTELSKITPASAGSNTIQNTENNSTENFIETLCID